MGYSKDPTAYPSEFAEVFRRALIESVEIECDTLQQATAFRHQLHGYRRAIEFVRTPGWSELRNISIQVRNSTLILANNTKLLAKMREAIERSEPSDKDLDKYLDNMDTGKEHD